MAVTVLRLRKRTSAKLQNKPTNSSKRSCSEDRLFQRMLRRRKVEAWLHQIEDYVPKPFAGHFPPEESDLKEQNIRTIKGMGDIEGRYRLEFTEHGHYVETRRCKGYEVKKTTITTALSARWLENRGYGDDAGT